VLLLVLVLLLALLLLILALLLLILLLILLALLLLLLVALLLLVLVLLVAGAVLLLLLLLLFEQFFHQFLVVLGVGVIGLLRQHAVIGGNRGFVLHQVGQGVAAVVVGVHRIEPGQILYRALVVLVAVVGGGAPGRIFEIQCRRAVGLFR